MNRRRTLIGINKSSDDSGANLPESTVFEFPLYFNTQVSIIDEYGEYRNATQPQVVMEWLEWVRNRYASYISGINPYPIPYEDLINYPVYIDGYQVTSATVYSWGIEQIVTDNDYGGRWSEIAIYTDLSNLYVDLYK